MLFHHDLLQGAWTESIGAPPMLQARKRLKTIISKWKEWTAKAIAISWHRDFFEHRLRQDESFCQKADYILLNPVCAGFVQRPEDWPYILVTNLW
jgi:uncharacterized heparinase superfamily protein